MTLMPFICLGAGLLISFRNLSARGLQVVDWVINIALVVLMLTIGMNIGINDSVMLNLPVIGLNCVVISLSAIVCSVILVVFIEKTVLPLSALQEKLYQEKIDEKWIYRKRKKKRGLRWFGSCPSASLRE